MASILIAGATGLVGSHVLALALADPRVERVVAPTRRPLPPGPGLDNPVVGDGPWPDSAGWWAVDGVALALGTTRAKAGSAAAFRAVDLDLALGIARRAREAGAVRLALTSSMGANSRSPFLYPRTKGELEQAVAGLGYPSLTIIRPGLLGGERREFRLGERAALLLLGLAAPILPRKARISPAALVARALVEAAIAAPPGRHLIESDRLAG